MKAALKCFLTTAEIALFITVLTAGFAVAADAAASNSATGNPVVTDEQAEFADSVHVDRIDAIIDSAKALPDSIDAREPPGRVVYTEAWITRSLGETSPLGVHRIVADGAGGTLLVGIVQLALESAEYAWVRGGVTVPVKRGEVTREPGEDPVCKGSCATLWVFSPEELAGMPLEQVKKTALENPGALPDSMKDRLKIRAVPQPITEVESSTPGGIPNSILIGPSEEMPAVLILRTS